MAHELEIINEQASMFYVGKAPWHNLGQRFIQPPTTEEALEAARLNWEVGMRPLFNAHGIRSTHKETFRMDNGKILGVVGPKYHPLQNTQAFGFFRPLVEDGTLAYETAGVLQDGKKVWILAKIARDPEKIVGDDTVESYVLLSNSHDGTMAIRVGYTPIRTVCANTLAAAIESKDSKLLRVRHTTNANAALTEIRKAMVVAEQTFQASAEQFRILTQYQVNAADIRNYVTQIFDVEADPTGKKKEPKALASVFRLFESGKGQDLPGVKGTIWALYNATTEAMQYELGRDDASRMNSMWFGTNASKNKEALKLAIFLAKSKAA